MRHLLRFGILVILLTCATAVMAQQAVGVIDMDKVQSDYKGFKEALTYLKNYNTERSGIYTDLQKGEFLSFEQFQELQKLAGRTVKINPARIEELLAVAGKNKEEYNALNEKLRANLTPEDLKQIEELQKAAQYAEDIEKIQQEYDAILDRGKAKLTDAERARAEEMEDHRMKVVESLNKVGSTYNREVNEERTRIMDLLSVKVQEAISAVSKTQKLGVVLNKSVVVGQASLKLVMWGGTDITEAVTKALNAGFKPEMFRKP